MSPDIIILLLGLVALMALGIPICFAMMSVASVILLVFYGSGLLNVLNAAFVYQMQSESLLAIPMFALMAAFLQTSGIGGDIYEFFHKWMGGVNGGLAMATVATTAVIAAMSGVAATATIMMGLIALPAMLDRGYDKALATGPVLAGGCLGPIIPPSTIMIIMSSYTGVSAGWLFAGGVLPGVGLALLFIIYIGIRCAINPKLGPGIDKYLKGVATVSTENRLRILRLIENLALGTAAVGYRTESMHGAGSPQAQRIMISRQGNLAQKKALAKAIAHIKE